MEKLKQILDEYGLSFVSDIKNNEEFEEYVEKFKQTTSILLIKRLLRDNFRIRIVDPGLFRRRVGINTKYNSLDHLIVREFAIGIFEGVRKKDEINTVAKFITQNTNVALKQKIQVFFEENPRNFGYIESEFEIKKMFNKNAIKEEVEKINSLIFELNTDEVFEQGMDKLGIQIRKASEGLTIKEVIEEFGVIKKAYVKTEKDF